MSYGLVYTRGGKMLLRRLNAKYEPEAEEVVKDPLEEAMAELPNAQTIGLMWIKPPGELFLLATVEMERAQGGPRTAHEMFNIAAADPNVRAGLQDFIMVWLEALDIVKPVPIWDS